jgi:hypothetical protein
MPALPNSLGSHSFSPLSSRPRQMHLHRPSQARCLLLRRPPCRGEATEQHGLCPRRTAPADDESVAGGRSSREWRCRRLPRSPDPGAQQQALGQAIAQQNGVQGPVQPADVIQDQNKLFSLPSFDIGSVFGRR